MGIKTYSVYRYNAKPDYKRQTKGSGAFVRGISIQKLIRLSESEPEVLNARVEYAALFTKSTYNVNISNHHCNAEGVSYGSRSVLAWTTDIGM